MEKRTDIQEESKAMDKANRKSWPDLHEEKESQDTNF
jgi:hypothetical protein